MEKASFYEVVIGFTDAVIQEMHSQRELEAYSDEIQADFGITEDDLVEEVFQRLLLLARFCQCRP